MFLHFQARASVSCLFGYTCSVVDRSDCLGDKGHAHLHAIRYVSCLAIHLGGLSQTPLTVTLLSAPTHCTTPALQGLLTVHTAHYTLSTIRGQLPSSVEHRDVGGCNSTPVEVYPRTLEM
jgi:hypothetical protein